MTELNNDFQGFEYRVIGYADDSTEATHVLYTAEMNEVLHMGRIWLEEDFEVVKYEVWVDDNWQEFMVG